MLYLYPKNTCEKNVEEKPQNSAYYGQEGNQGKGGIPFLNLAKIDLCNLLFSLIRTLSPKIHKCQGPSKKKNEGEGREQVENKMSKIPQFKEMQNRSSGTEVG